MKDDFIHVLENYPNVDLSKKEDRELLADALVNIMCSHHIVTYTDLEAVRKDPVMLNWIQQCKARSDDSETDQPDLPFEKSL